MRGRKGALKHGGRTAVYRVGEQEDVSGDVTVFANCYPKWRSETSARTDTATRRKHAGHTQ